MCSGSSPKERAAMNNTQLELRVESDVVAARQTGREMARELGFGVADQTRLATAISELTRNVIVHAGEGVCRIYDRSDAQAARVQVVAEDKGAGIPDIEQAMAQGFSTGGGLGAGLPGAKRLVQEFDIESEPGHTKVTIAITKPRVRVA